MQYFNLHTHQFTNQPDVLELVNQYPQEFDASIPFYSIGIHPLYIDENRLESDFQIVDQKLALPECLALGECGLDKRGETSFEIQQSVFAKHKLCGFLTFKLFLPNAAFQFTYAPIYESTGCLGVG